MNPGGQTLLRAHCGKLLVVRLQQCGGGGHARRALRRRLAGRVRDVAEQRGARGQRACLRRVGHVLGALVAVEVVRENAHLRCVLSWVCSAVVLGLTDSD